jgi:hypothetical protein
MKPYYYVFKPGSGGYPPTKKHETQQAAVDESMRLANMHPSQAFEVCKVIAVTQCSKPSTFFMDGETPVEKRPFKVGDRVRVTKYWSLFAGMVGEINDASSEKFSVGDAPNYFTADEIEHV